MRNLEIGVGRRDIYAMRRANGDWFAFEHQGRLQIPLFRSSHDALMARLRDVGMRVFNPVALDAGLFRKLAPAGSERNAFVMINDPFVSLSRGSPVKHAQLESQMHRAVKSITATPAAKNAS